MRATDLNGTHYDSVITFAVDDEAIEYRVAATYPATLTSGGSLVFFVNGNQVMARAFDASGAAAGAAHAVQNATTNARLAATPIQSGGVAVVQVNNRELQVSILDDAGNPSDGRPNSRPGPQSTRTRQSFSSRAATCWSPGPTAMVHWRSG